MPPLLCTVNFEGISVWIRLPYVFVAIIVYIIENSQKNQKMLKNTPKNYKINNTKKISHVYIHIDIGNPAKPGSLAGVDLGIPAFPAQDLHWMLSSFYKSSCK